MCGPARVSSLWHAGHGAAQVGPPRPAASCEDRPGCIRSVGPMIVDTPGIPYSMAFRVLIIGGTGQVGAAVVRALVAEPSCAEVVMVNRKTMPLTANPRLRQVVLNTAA